MAWRLGQWEELLKTSKFEGQPSTKLSLLLLQKLSEQLERDLGVGTGGNINEARNMRNLLLLHCKSARNQMMEHRTPEVALDRCSVPLPIPMENKWNSLRFEDARTTPISTSFLDLESNPSKNVLDVVEQNKGTRPPFQCHFCYQSFTTEQMRWVHQEIGGHDSAMTSVKFICFEELCKGLPAFSTFKDLETHFETVHQTEDEGEDVHKCSLCEWPFSSDDLRRVHELVHGNYVRTGYDNKSFNCPGCDCPGFKTFPPLQTHFISKHTNLDSERLYKCHKCWKSYRTPKSLAQHLATHEVEENLAKSQETGGVGEAEAGSSDVSKYYICTECGRPCGTSRFLREHHRIHHETKQCHLCGEILLSSKMPRHMRLVHQVDAQGKHSCPVCHKKFFVKQKMRRHLEHVHKDREDEICHICSKRYNIKGRLQLHLRIAHQIEAEELKRDAKFICPHCGVGYYYKSSLNQHVDQKHRSKEERLFHSPCTLCSKSFRRKSDLTKHLEKAHGQIQTQDDQDLQL